MPSERGDVSYSYKRASILEGTFPRDAGYFIVTECRVRFGWGGIDPGDWPNSSHGAAVEPPGLDQIAKTKRLRAYWRIDNLNDAARSLAIGPFAAAFEATHEWFYTTGGRIDVPQLDAKVIGTHVVCVNGYAGEDDEIHFINSWGADWGVNGCGTMSRRFFDAKLCEAWAMLPGNARFERQSGHMRLENGYKTPLGVLHVVELYDADRDDRMAWTLLLERENCLEMQDLFVKPQYRKRGLARSLVAEIHRVRRERLQSKVPLRAFAYSLDAAMFPEATRRIAKHLGLELVQAKVPWAAYVAQPAEMLWKSRRHRKRL